MAWNLGGEVQKADHREYGSADITINTFGGGTADALFEGLGDQMRVSSQLFLANRIERLLGGG
jgi:GMP synthase (glutamine-hydrolysing)